MRIWLLTVVFLLLFASVAALEIESSVEDKVEQGNTVKVIVVFEDSAALEAFQAQLARTTAEVTAAAVAANDTVTEEPEYVFGSFPGMIIEVTEEELEALKNNPDVAAVYDGERKFHITLSQSVPFINGSNVWPITVAGTNITGKYETVCVIDTGINYSHVALSGCLGSGCRVLGGYDYVNNDADPMDDNGHGTHVAGIVASNDSTNKGVAPEANLVSLKAFDFVGDGSFANVAKALDWCTNNRTAFNISIISMSFGDGIEYNSGNCPSNTAITNSLNNAAAAGLVLVAASGNELKTAGISYPSCNANVTSVGSVERATDAIPSYSNTGSNLDLLAPGGKSGAQITSTAIFGGFTNNFGTSMATPHVSGAAALLIQYNKLKNSKTLTPAQVETRFKATGKNVTDLDNGLSFPRINALLALAPQITVESPQNTTHGTGDLDFNITVDSNITSAVVSVDGGANSSLTNDSSAHWYNTTIANVSDGQHNATFYVVSDVNNSKTVFFTVDFNGPSIVLVSPTNGSSIDPGRLIDLNITDISNVSTVKYSLNGTANISVPAPYDIDTANWSKGINNISVYANDSFGNSNSTFLQFNVSNTIPSWSGMPIFFSVNEDSQIIIDANATDADNDTLTYNVTNLPSGATINNSTGVFTWTPPDANVGNNTITFRANDGKNNSDLNITVQVNNTNDAPVLSPISDKTATTGSQFTLDVSASDDDMDSGDVLTFTDNSTLFDIAKTSNTTARIQFTPSTTGTHAILITVTDSAGNSSSDSFKLTISSGGGGGGGGGGGTTTNETSNQTTTTTTTTTTDTIYDAEKQFDLISATGTATFSPGISNLAVNSITIDTVNDAANVNLKVRKVSNPVVAVSGGKAYQYFDIVADNLDNANIEQVTIEFSVPKSWLSSNGISSDTVRLEHYDSNWVRLPTNAKEEIEASVVYSASTTSLSTFAIVGDEGTAPVGPAGPVDSGSGVTRESFTIRSSAAAASDIMLANPKTVVTIMVVAAIAITVFIVMSRLNIKMPKRPKKQNSFGGGTKRREKVSAPYKRDFPDFGFGN